MSRIIFSVLVFISCLGITLYSWSIFSQLETENAHYQFHKHTHEITSRVQERLRGYEQILYGGLGFINGSHDITRDEWRTFVSFQRLDDLFPGMTGFGFTRQIKPQDLDDHIAGMRRELFPEFSVWPEGNRPVYTSVILMEPHDRYQQRVFGYDMFADPDRRAAMEQARDSGDTAITGRLEFQTGNNEMDQYGFLMFVPYYQSGETPATIKARREALVGYIIAPIRIHALLTGIIDNTNFGINLSLHDGSATVPQTLLFSTGQTNDHRPSYTHTEYLQHHGRIWAFSYSSLPAFENTVSRYISWVILIGGILISFLSTTITWFQSTNRKRTIELGQINRHLNDEITERRRAEGTLRLLARAVESSVNAIIITDPQQEDNPIVYVNPAFERITGYTVEEATGRNCRFLQNNDHNQPELDKLRELIRNESDGHVVLRNYRKDGSLFWNELYISTVRDKSGNVTNFVGIQNDVTENRSYQEQLEHQATHDSLTGLANKAVLYDRIQQSINLSRRKKLKVGIVFIDLDHFKIVNDSLGHDAGDLLLREVATRLESNIRQGDSVARIGGDEFVLVFNEQEDTIDISNSAERIMQHILQPATILDREIILTCSMGISLFPEDGDTADILLKNADSAMYRAKEQGRNDICFYKPEMNELLAKRLGLVSGIHRALEKNEFILHFQPQVDIASEKIIGLEALVRWNHPDSGLLSPAEFIPLAEDTGQIIAIGEWVMNTACRQSCDFQNKGYEPITMAINLSARQFIQKGLFDTIKRILEREMLPPELLEIEITESMMMYDIKSAIKLLNELKDIGVQLAIDDFGTGYSSLAYLKDFPIDHLKLDKSFVQNVTNNPDDASIARAIISLAHNLDIRVIAEGVETSAQLAFLRQIRCDEAQGYYFSKPLPAIELENLLRNGLQVT